MSLGSVQFLLFLAAAYAAFLAAPDRLRWAVLLVASGTFYAAFGAPVLLLVLALSIGVAYAVGRALGNPLSPSRRRALFWTGTLLQLSLLAAFKFALPLLDALRTPGASATGTAPEPLALVGAVGLSYYVFQAIAYQADVYLEVVPPERHLGLFALYLAFFPKLTQGPIERPGDLLPQLRRPFRFDHASAREGLVLVAWGLFKYLVVAGRLARTVDEVYGDVHGYGPTALLLATYCYALQLYCDFSGYTDIARGAARLFNVSLARNFDAPYTATSIAEFWRRWHMSFSRWLLDYLFRPLQMTWRRWRTHGTVAALFVTFLVCGVWHGPRWTFVAWGALHGVYLAASVYWRPWQARLHRALGPRVTRALAPWRGLVVFHMVCAAWVFFRATSLGDALHVLATVGGRLPEAIAGIWLGVPGRMRLPGMSSTDVAIVLAAAPLVVWEKALGGPDPWKRPLLVRWTAYVALSLSIIVFGLHGENTFIYSRF